MVKKLFTLQPSVFNYHFDNLCDMDDNEYYTIGDITAKVYKWHVAVSRYLQILDGQSLSNMGMRRGV